MSAMKKRVNPEEISARIVDAAENLFREVGYSKTTVADIAAALGMSPANVYRYFESKAAINESICERLVRQVENRCQKTLRDSVSNKDGLVGFFLEYHRSVKRILLTEKRMHDMVTAAMEENWSVIRRHIKRMQDLLQTLLQSGINNGEFRAVPTHQTAKLLHGAVGVFVFPALLERIMADNAADGVEDSLEEDLRHLLDLLLKGLQA